MSRVESHIQEKLAPFQDKRFLLACSGGLDSMVLAELLLRIGIPFELAHVNYGLRENESELDEALIRDFAKQHNLPCHVKRIDPNILQENLQAEARKIRYNWFEQLKTERHLDFILLAHHADDHVETFYLNLGRDAGIMGLACMPFQRGDLLRPLLEIDKEELLNFARKHGIHWREDASNSSLKYTRNRLRNEFLPKLNAALPELKESVLFLIQTFQQNQLELEKKIGQFAEDWKCNSELEIANWNAFQAHEKVELLRQLGQSASLVRHLDQLSISLRGSMAPIHKNALCPFSHILREANFFRLTNLDSSGKKYGLILEKVEDLPHQFDKDSIYLDASKIQGILGIRPWQHGDRMASVGVPGTQLIGDIISDARVPIEEKSNIPVVHDDVHIHWCPGLKIGRLALATKDQTSEILRVTIWVEALPKSDDLSRHPDSED